jgi:hypothetical protein
MSTHDTPLSAADADAGLHLIEGYLYWQAENAAAQAKAEEFADRLPWLTRREREDVIHLYTDERLELSRTFVDRTAQRALQLQHEYTHRYRQLKARLLIAAITTITAMTTTVLLTPHVT